jgi:hypothetical protein
MLSLRPREQRASQICFLCAIIDRSSEEKSYRFYCCVHGQIRKRLIKMRNAINFQPRMCTDVVDEIKTILFVYSTFCLFLFSFFKFKAFLLVAFFFLQKKVEKFLLHQPREKHVNTLLIAFFSSVAPANCIHQQMHRDIALETTR